MGNALDVSGLSKTYPGFALADVSFGLPEGYIMGFVGRNGSGKTTTIKCMLDMIAREAGPRRSARARGRRRRHGQAGCRRGV
jgi:ABC-2 type transport system ATP-binding protein